MSQPINPTLNGRDRTGTEGQTSTSPYATVVATAVRGRRTLVMRPLVEGNGEGTHDSPSATICRRWSLVNLKCIPSPE